jgi:dTMP kinase
MKKQSYPGLFIAFEGLDGSGSSTQADLLVKGLNSQGYFAFQTKEPTNNLIGGLIRGALTKDWKASPECLQLLFAADRAHHLNREVIPALEKGKIMVTDRYFFSTVAFGSIDLDQDWLLALNQEFILPDITFLIKVRPKECIRRISGSRNEFELFEQEQKLEKVWYTYAKIQRKKEFNICLIDGERPIVEIQDRIITEVAKVLKAKLKGLQIR